jgi:DnaJ family protein C protein 28
MDFKDWRVPAPDPALPDVTSSAQTAASPVSEQRTQSAQEQRIAGNRYHGKRFGDYIDDQIREAEERGAFRNLPGFGRPLNLDTNPYAGERALGYSLLKSNGYLPAEIELAREINRDLEGLETRRTALSKRGRDLRRRRIAPFASEKRAYNTAVNKALAEYETTLRELNRKILTLNVSTPAAMHRAPLDIERMAREFREACPLFSEENSRR